MGQRRWRFHSLIVLIQWQSCPCRRVTKHQPSRQNRGLWSFLSFCTSIVWQLWQLCCNAKVGIQRQVPIVRKAQRTVDSHQVRFVDSIVDLPVVMQIEHWVYVSRESPENFGGPACPVHRFDRRCDSVWQHQVRTIRAVQKTKEVAHVRFLITATGENVPVNFRVT